MKTKKERKQFLQDNFKISTLNFKFSNSGVCRIYNFRGEKTSFYAGGYGYDKKGTCLGELMNYYFLDELKKLKSGVNTEFYDRKNGFYGLHHYNSKTRKYQKKSSKHTKTYLDGACGFESMKIILNKIGFKLTFIYEDSSCDIYRMEAK